MTDDEDPGGFSGVEFDSEAEKAETAEAMETARKQRRIQLRPPARDYIRPRKVRALRAHYRTDSHIDSGYELCPGAREVTVPERDALTPFFGPTLPVRVPHAPPTAFAIAMRPLQ